MERPGNPRTLVHFRCVNPDHARPTPERSDTLTLVEGLWAYCPFNVRAPDHRWVPTGGAPLEELRR
jgi:hypothetical protein